LRNYPIDQPDAQCVLRIDKVAREDHFHRVATTNNVTQSNQGTIAGMKSPLHVLQAEFRML
jgi:hypothetical protein